MLLLVPHGKMIFVRVFRNSQNIRVGNAILIGNNFFTVIHNRIFSFHQNVAGMNLCSFFHLRRSLTGQYAVNNSLFLRHQIPGRSVFLRPVLCLLVGGQVFLHVNNQHGAFQLCGSPDNIPVTCPELFLDFLTVYFAF